MGVELGGSKCILSLDNVGNITLEGEIYTEISWATFYQEEGIEDQIDTFTTKEYSSVRDDPEQLANRIIKAINKIVDERKLLYGIGDFEVDAFMDENVVIEGLDLDYTTVNKLMKAHKKSRDQSLFPKLIKSSQGNRIEMEFQGLSKNLLHIIGNKIEDLADNIRNSSGFGVGLVCTSKNAANFYIISDNIVKSDNEFKELEIDKENIDVVFMAIQREWLFPISWFRIDMGVKAFETLELWEEVKGNPELQVAFNRYDDHLKNYIYNKYRSMSEAPPGKDLKDSFYDMTPEEKEHALRDMKKAIGILDDHLEEARSRE